ncbi:MAG: hypothetical protein IMF06_15890 [Proteobacteria bacterium]|nr:hypothetical protein [Pseudomonadota bacterium]
MNILETEWWSMALPPEWWAESEEESILVGDRDDVGCLEFTTLHKESGEFDAAEVLGIAEAESEQKLTWKPLTLGDFKGVASSFIEDEAAIREWYLASGALLLFITYSCDEDNAGMDDAAVNEILDTLMVVPA